MGYYMTTNGLTPTAPFVGAFLFALERSAMLTGATPRSNFLEPQPGRSELARAPPADFEGTSTAPAGSPRHGCSAQIKQVHPHSAVFSQRELCQRRFRLRRRRHAIVAAATSLTPAHRLRSMHLFDLWRAPILEIRPVPCSCPRSRPEGALASSDRPVLRFQKMLRGVAPGKHCRALEANRNAPTKVPSESNPLVVM